mgnify:CR=1 FL=1
MENINTSSLTYAEKIKKILDDSKYNLTTLNDEINKLNGTNTTVQNLSARLKKRTLRYDEVEQILNILNYKIEWKHMPMRVQVHEGNTIRSEYPPRPKRISNPDIVYEDEHGNKTYAELKTSVRDNYDQLIQEILLKEVECQVREKVNELIHQSFKSLDDVSSPISLKLNLDKVKDD